MTLKAIGKKLRTLRKAVRKHSLRASVTVSTLSGETPAKAQTTVRL